MTGEALHQLIRYTLETGDHVYGITDAARCDALAVAAFKDYGLVTRSLFPEETAPHMATVSPYLVAMEYRSRYPFEGSGYLDLWAEHMGRSEGILLLSQSDPDALRSHLRTIFLVDDDAGRRFFFRFYDPRVLRCYLPTCTAQEVMELFGPIRRILVESASSDTMHICRVDKKGVGIHERSEPATTGKDHA